MLRADIRKTVQIKGKVTTLASIFKPHARVREWEGFIPWDKAGIGEARPYSPMRYMGSGSIGGYPPKKDS